MLIDGQFTDWDEVSYLYRDSVSDVAAGQWISVIICLARINPVR